jgi:hypothetical protein
MQEKNMCRNANNMGGVDIANLKLFISEEALIAINEFIGEHPAERGGILGWDSDNIIRHFEPDPTGRCSAGAYDPDIEKMNTVIKRWKKAGIQFCCFVHSHPPRVKTLSSHDEWYAGEILMAFKKLNLLWLPIVMTIPDTGQFKIFPYAAIPSDEDGRQCPIVNATLRVVDRQGMTVRSECSPQDARTSVQQKPTTGLASRGIAHISTAKPKTSEPNEVQLKEKRWNYFGHFEYLWRSSRLNPHRHQKIATKQFRGTVPAALRKQRKAKQLRDKYLSRIATAYNLKLLDRTRLIFIGTGGAASIIRNCARMGFGEFVLIDPDIVTETNVATQQATPETVGIPKVEALARDIVEINPAAAVLSIKERIEHIDDEQFSLLFKETLRGKTSTVRERRTRATCDVHNSSVNKGLPYQTILFVLTDNFWAQARGHRLGLNFGLATICAQEYIDGRGAEITYTVPGVTPACHRCITASRYRAYLQQNYFNVVTSEGAPIFAAEFLNAVLGHILLAVAHYGSKNSRWGDMIARLGNRNLIRIRMDPDFDKYFGDTFAKRHAGAKGAESLFMLDCLFVPQTADCGQSKSRPVCPDCLGTGDLRDAMGTFTDTLDMRREAPHGYVQRSSTGSLLVKTEL